MSEPRKMRARVEGLNPDRATVEGLYPALTRVRAVKHRHHARAGVR